MKAFLRANWDRAIAAGLVVLGVIALIIGWFGVSRTGLAAEQNPYLISGGLFGIALIGLGCTLWLSADLQDEWRRLDSIEERLGQLQPSGSSDDGRTPGPDSATSARPVMVDDGRGNGETPRRRRTPVRSSP